MLRGTIHHNNGNIGVNYLILRFPVSQIRRTVSSISIVHHADPKVYQIVSRHDRKHQIVTRHDRKPVFSPVERGKKVVSQRVEQGTSKVSRIQTMSMGVTEKTEIKEGRDKTTIYELLQRGHRLELDTKSDPLRVGPKTEDKS